MKYLKLPVALISVLGFLASENIGAHAPRASASPGGHRPRGCASIMDRYYRGT